MSDKVTARPTGEPVRRPPTALLAAILVLLGGCSTPDWVAVPDWANPVEWFGDETAASEPGSSDEAFP